MKRVLRNVLLGVGFCLLLLAFAEAQEVGLITAHIDGVQVPSATGPIFSNCGAKPHFFEPTLLTKRHRPPLFFLALRPSSLIKKRLELIS